MLQPPSQRAGADTALVFLCSPETDATYIAYTDSNAEYMRGESKTEQLAASINPAFRAMRRRPTLVDTAADEDPELKSLSSSDGPLGRQDQNSDAQRARSAGASSIGNDTEGNYLPSGLQDHHDGLSKTPSVTGKPERPHSPIVIIRGAADGACRSIKASICAADDTAAQAAPTLQRPQYQPSGDHPQQSLSFTPSYSAPVDEHQRATTVDFSKATAHSSQAPLPYRSDMRHLAASDDLEFGTAHGCQNSQDRTAHGCQSSPNVPTPLVVTYDSGAGPSIQHGRDSRASDIDPTLAAPNALPLADIPTRTRTRSSLTTRQREIVRSIGSSHPCINAAVLNNLALHCAAEFDKGRNGRAFETDLDQWLLESLQGAAELFVQHPHVNSRDAVAKAIDLHSARGYYSLLSWLQEVYASKVNGGREGSHGSERTATPLASTTRGAQRPATPASQAAEALGIQTALTHLLQTTADRRHRAFGTAF